MQLPVSCHALIAIALMGSSGCQHIGPRTIMDDRIPYNEAISTTWKQQTLLNLVRLRYMDLPEFVDVSSVVNGYEHGHTTSGSLGTQLYPRAAVSNFLNLGFGGSRTMVDRPTISYTPQGTSEFTRSLINPIPPISILNLIESGAPADVVLELAVESINGVRNRGFTGELQMGDPEYQQAIEIMKKGQASGNVSLRVMSGEDKDGEESLQVLMGIRDTDISPELAAELDHMRNLLRLDPEIRQFRIVFGMLPEKNDEIAFRTRSLLRIMNYLSLYVQVPPEHLADGRASDWGDFGTPAPPMVVYSGCEPPCDSYAAVQYQGYWFWIDQRDFNSKRSMGYLKVLLALVDTRQRDAAPALTIRAN